MVVRHSAVVVPCLNRAEFLRETLESIFSQDYPNIECIVVDGSSTDGTQAILREFGQRVVWWSEPDDGPFDAINKGWAVSKGGVLAWLNADDKWAPGAVRAAVDYFASHPMADVVYGHCRGIDESGHPVWWGTARPWGCGARWWAWITPFTSQQHFFGAGR